MTSQGSRYGQFQRALERGNLLAALSAARDLPQVGLQDALRLCVLLAREDARRFERAAVRWHARLELERPRMTLLEAQLAAAALSELRGGNTRAALRILEGLCRPAGHSAVD